VKRDAHGMAVLISREGQIVMMYAVLALFAFGSLVKRKPESVRLAYSETECSAGMGNSTLKQTLAGGAGALRSNYELDELVEGPGLYDIRENRSACEFQNVEHSGHFPHAMQQMYRCFSYWMASAEDAKYPKRDRYLVVSRRPMGTEFMKGFVQQLRLTFGVKVVNLRHNLKIVRPSNFSTGFASRNAFAMRGQNDARALRDGIWKAYGIPQSTACGGLDPTNATTVRIGILDRKVTRKLHNLGAIVRAIEREMHKEPLLRAKFVIGDFEYQTFQEQVEFLSGVDVLVSPHGAQLTGIPFLPNCASVLELFPTGYLIPQYFGSLAAVAGVTHSYMYLGGPDADREAKVAMKTLESRDAARAVNLCPHPDAVARSVVELVREWHRCCQIQR
jgi:Glycosyltransferase 61